MSFLCSGICNNIAIVLHLYFKMFYTDSNIDFLTMMFLLHKLGYGEECVTVNEAIKELQVLSNQGYGQSTVRSYMPVIPEQYSNIGFVLHRAKDNIKKHYEAFRDWIEVI